MSLETSIVRKSEHFITMILKWNKSVEKKMGHCNGFFTLCPLLLLLTLPSLSGADLEFDFSAKIRDLNLFPSQDVNIVHHPNCHANKVVEKPLRFPNLLPSHSGVSLDNLTHSAGYYPIVHSHAARFAFDFIGCRFQFMFFNVHVELNG